MFNIGPAELLVIGLVLLIAVGPEQLPGVIRRFGSTVAQVRSMTDGLRSEFMAGLDEIERATDVKSWSTDGDSTKAKNRTPVEPKAADLAADPVDDVAVRTDAPVDDAADLVADPVDEAADPIDAPVDDAADPIDAPVDDAADLVADPVDESAVGQADLDGPIEASDDAPPDWARSPDRGAGAASLGEHEDGSV